MLSIDVELPGIHVSPFRMWAPTVSASAAGRPAVLDAEIHPPTSKTSGSSQMPGTLAHGNRALDCHLHLHAIHPRPSLDFQD